MLSILGASDGRRDQAGRVQWMQALTKILKAVLPLVVGSGTTIAMVLVVTDLLEQNVPLEDVQVLVGHSQPQTTQIYDCRNLNRTGFL